MNKSLSPPSLVPHSRFFEWWARVVLVLRLPLLLGCAALTVLAAREAADGLRVDVNTQAFVPRGAPEAHSLLLLRRDFGPRPQVTLQVEGHVFSETFLQRLSDLHSDLENLEGRAPARTIFSEEDGDGLARSAAGYGPGAVRQVRSLVSEIQLWHPQEQEGETGAPGAESWPDRSPTSRELAAWRARATRSPRMLDSVVDADGRRAFVRVEIAPVAPARQREALEQIRDVGSLYAAPGFRVTVGGPLAAEEAVRQGVVADLEFLLAAELVALLLMMWFAFRHTLAVLGPLAVVGQAVVCMFGWMAFAEIPLTPLSAVLGALVLCLGISFSVHLLTVHRCARRLGMDGDAAIVHAVATTGVPVLFTTLGSCLAMLALLWARVEPIRQLGLSAATGVFLAGLLTLTFLPAWLSLGPRRRGRIQPPAYPWRGVGRVLAVCDRLSRGSRARRGVLAGLGAVSLALFGWGLTRLHVQHDPAAGLPSAAGTQDTAPALSDAFLALHVTAEQGDVLQPELLAGLDRGLQGTRRHPVDADQRPLVLHARSLLDELREAAHARELPELDPSSASRAQLVDLVGLSERTAPHALREVLTVDRAATQATLQLAPGDARTYRNLMSHVERLVDRELAGVAQVRLAGPAADAAAVLRALPRELVRCFAVAFGIVALTLFALFRDARLAAVALLSSTWPPLAMLGLTGLTGRALDTQSVLLACLAIGFGLESSVHFLHYFRIHYAGYGDVDAAVAHAFERKGRAMLGTAVVLLGGFSVLLLGYLESTRSFGMLALWTVAFVLFSELLWAPALLRTLFRSRPRVYDPEVVSSYDLRVSEFS